MNSLENPNILSNKIEDEFEIIEMSKYFQQIKSIETNVVGNKILFCRTPAQQPVRGGIMRSKLRNMMRHYNLQDGIVRSIS